MQLDIISNGTNWCVIELLYRVQLYLPMTKEETVIWAEKNIFVEYNSIYRAEKPTNPQDYETVSACVNKALTHMVGQYEHYLGNAIHLKRSVDHIHTMNMISQRDVDRLNYTKKQITELLVKISKCVEAIKNLSLILSTLEHPTNTIRDLEEWVNTYHITVNM